MWRISGITMTLTKSGGLQFRTAEDKRAILLRLLERVTNGDSIRITPLSFTVRKGRFLVTSDSMAKLMVYFGYTFRNRMYGLYIVQWTDELVITPMKAEFAPPPFDENRWLNKLGANI